MVQLVRRYHSPTVVRLLRPLLEAEETRNQIKRDFHKTMLAKLDEESTVRGGGSSFRRKAGCSMALPISP